MDTFRFRHHALKIALSVLLLSVATSGSAATRVYKWTDKDGNVHYSATPSAQNKNETIRLHDEAPRIPPPHPGDSGEASANQEGEQPAPEVQKATAQVRKYQQELKKFCNNARANIVRLSGLPRIMTPAKDGSGPRRMGEEERLAELARLRKGVAKNCN